MAPKSQKKNPKAPSSASGSSSEPSRKTLQVLKEFSMEEIRDMTHNFGHLHGSGHYGKVYKGELDSEEIAVKVYPKKYENLAENEKEAFSILGSYEYIISCRGICFDRDYYFVMKFVPKNLLQLLEASQLKWKETVMILVQMANALEAIIHEDYVIANIKPDNILIDELIICKIQNYTYISYMHMYVFSLRTFILLQGFHVYMCDFGSAKKGGRYLPTFNKLYTPKEVVDKGHGTLQSDIYNFGAILLQMIMKYNGFEERDYGKFIEQEVKSILNMVHGKKDRKAAKSSRGVENPNVVIQARLVLKSRDHLVHKTVMQSGCDEDDAQKITQLGIECTSEHGNLRPAIQHIISTLGQLKIK